MSARKAKAVELALTGIAQTDEEWAATMSKPGLRVVDVYSKWAGTYT
jgi:hypothetical protein